MFPSIFSSTPQNESKDVSSQVSTLIALPHRLTSSGHPSLVKITKPKGKSTKNTPGPIYHYSRWLKGVYQGGTPTLISTLSSTTSVPNRYAASFTLSDVVNYSEFTALFDEWKIDSVEVHFIPRNNKSGTGTGLDGPATSAAYVSWLDFDNVGFVGSDLDDGLQSHTFQVSDCHSKTVRKFTPLCNMQTTKVDGTIVTGVSLTNPWLDCATPGVANYGIKFGIYNTSGNADVIIDIFTKYNLSFRCTR